MADGQVLIDSKLNTSGVERGAKEIKEEFQELAKVTEKVAEKMEKELNGAGDAAEKTSGSFKDLFNANLSASVVLDVLKQMGQAAIELGEQAVETAAEINASNAQFEQTFKGIEKTARDSLNKISKEVGITATRMQDSYTKIFAFTKSVGADQEQALSISERALKAAADSAAYYDVSVEDATETLMSFIKGNYENDAALGIAATETTRNAKANELYAKSFQESFGRCTMKMLVYAEMYGAQYGMGYYVKKFADFGMYNKVWLGFVFMVIVMVIVMQLFEKLKERLLKWTIN